MLRVATRPLAAPLRASRPPRSSLAPALSLLAPLLSPARHQSSSSSSSTPYDLVVIGGGPGGYVAAIKAAQLGLRTACVERRDKLGGTCLNVGCIPSKAMLHNSKVYEELVHGVENRGVEVSGVSLNLEKMIAFKQKAVTGLTSGVAHLFKKNKVDYLLGHGSFVSSNRIRIDPSQVQDYQGFWKPDASGEPYEVETKNAIIATGSTAAPFPGLEIDEKRIVSSTGALELTELPRRMVVIGAGVIGLEMGSVWARLGSEVTVVEFLDAIGGPGFDKGMAKSFHKILAKQGLKFKMGTKVTGVENAQGEGPMTVKVEAAKGGSESEIEADVVLVAIGRKPVTENLGLEKVGVDVDERGRVVINNHFNTSAKGIKCIGDVTFGPMLAHKAEEEGVAAAEYIHSGHGHVNYGVIPSVIYTHPEVAWVGKNEEELKADGVEYSVGTFPFVANSRAKTVDDTEGSVKVLADKGSDKVLGVHIIGPNAGEMIAEACLAMEYGASAEDVARTCHPHPTMSEALKEAAMAAYDKPLNF